MIYRSIFKKLREFFADLSQMWPVLGIVGSCPVRQEAEVLVLDVKLGQDTAQQGTQRVHIAGWGGRSTVEDFGGQMVVIVLPLLLEKQIISTLVAPIWSAANGCREA